MPELMQLAAEMLAPKPRLPADNAAKASVLIVADSVQARFGIRSLINKLDWLRLIPLEVAPEELFKRKINADIVLLSANKLTFTQLEALAKRFLVVCCVEHATRSAVFSMLRAGIAGVIPLELGSHEFNSALQAVHNGLQVVHKSFTEENKPSAIDAEHLTDREQEILGLMAEGLANKEISIRMAISENTVKFHISSVLGKLSASSRTEAVSIGIRRGLLAI
jgi:two-component system, NarL family, response regulator YdfI